MYALFDDSNSVLTYDIFNYNKPIRQLYKIRQTNWDGILYLRTLKKLTL